MVDMYICMRIQLPVLAYHGMALSHKLLQLYIIIKTTTFNYSWGCLSSTQH